MPLKVLNYDQMLRNLEDHHNAIAINTQNNHSLIDKIKSLWIGADEVGFLENFPNSTSKPFQDQIQVDLRYLTSAQGLFQE